MNKYQIFCTTENSWHEVIASSTPTKCPVNAVHTYDSSSIAIIEIDIKVNDGTLKDLTLEDYKQLRYNEIDYKTQSLLKEGFTYDGRQFSLSVEAQINWNGLKTNEADYTWPVSISTINHYEYILSQANLAAFWTAGRDVVKGHLDSGRVLKKQIFDAVDEAGVDAIVDNR